MKVLHSLSGKPAVGSPNTKARMWNPLGYLLVYPKREDVRFLGDSEAKLKKYLFGQRRKPHLFCGECGCNVMIDFSASEFEKQRPFLGVNVSGVSLRHSDEAENLL